MGNIEDIRKILQDFVAPEIREIRGEIKANAVRLDSLRSSMDIQFNALNTRFDDLIERLSLERRIEELERRHEDTH